MKKKKIVNLSYSEDFRGGKQINMNDFDVFQSALVLGLIWTMPGLHYHPFCPAPYLVSK